MVEFSHSKPMSNLAPAVHAYLEVMFSHLPRQLVPISKLPFFIGRGSENGNHLNLDDLRSCLELSISIQGERLLFRRWTGKSWMLWGRKPQVSSTTPV